VKKYVGRPNHTVIAAVRNPSHPSSKALTSIPVGEGSKIIVVKLESANMDDPKAAVKILNDQYGIESIDVIIANAGIVRFNGTALDTPVDGFKEHLAINTVAVLALFQATWPLLQRSSNPKFVSISSTVGSIGEMANWRMNATAYGASKAALNWLTRSIHFDNPSLIAFPIHPGWVQTDMGNAGAVANGLKEAPTTIQDCVDGMVSKIDTATREKTSGTFVSFDGEQISW